MAAKNHDFIIAGIRKNILVITIVYYYSITIYHTTN